MQTNFGMKASLSDHCLQKENFCYNDLNLNESIKEKSSSIGLHIQSYCQHTEMQKSKNQKNGKIQRERETLSRIIENIPYSTQYPKHGKSGNKNRFYQQRLEDQSAYRDIKVLSRKVETNYKLLIDQTKQLLSLSYSQILKEEAKIYKSAIMETKIALHRMKIKNRGHSKNELIGIEPLRFKNNLKSYSAYKKFENQSIDGDAEKQRKKLMKQRINLLKSDIENKRQCTLILSNNLQKQNDLLRREIGISLNITRAKAKSLIIYYQQLHSIQSENKKSLSIQRGKLNSKRSREIKSSSKNFRAKSPTMRLQQKSPYFNF